MPYATIVRSTGQPVPSHERPTGLLARIVGETEAGCHVVEVWQTQAQYDRFVAEVLYPAFERIERRPDDPPVPVGFHVTDLYLADPHPEETP